MLQAYKSITMLLKASLRSSESIYKQSHAAQVAPSGTASRLFVMAITAPGAAEG
jgi:hypothetical protein